MSTATFASGASFVFAIFLAFIEATISCHWGVEDWLLHTSLLAAASALGASLFFSAGCRVLCRTATPMNGWRFGVGVASSWVTTMFLFHSFLEGISSLALLAAYSLAATAFLPRAT